MQALNRIILLWVLSMSFFVASAQQTKFDYIFQEAMRQKLANKYGVDFAIIKDKNETPSKYTVFFKARDADAITQVLKEYAAKQTKRKKSAEKERPSVLQKLKKFKEKVASMPRKSKEKRKEMER